MLRFSSNSVFVQFIMLKKPFEVPSPLFIGANHQTRSEFLVPSQLILKPVVIKELIKKIPWLININFHEFFLSYVLKKKSKLILFSICSTSIGNMILHHSFILLFLCLYIFYYNKYMFVLLISHILCSYLGFLISCFESRFKLIKDGNPSIKSTRLSPSRRRFCIFAGSHTESCWRCIIPQLV